MAHKTPYRPQHDVTQPFEDGFVEIYSVADGNLGTGRLPVEVLTLIEKFRYQNMKLGVTRYYSARQNQVEVSRVIRIPYVKRYNINNQCVAITEDKIKYRIDFTQAVATYPPALDLTLTKYEQNVKEEEEEDYGEE